MHRFMVYLIVFFYVSGLSKGKLHCCVMYMWNFTPTLWSNFVSFGYSQAPSANLLKSVDLHISNALKKGVESNLSVSYY